MLKISTNFKNDLNDRLDYVYKRVRNKSLNLNEDIYVTNESTVDSDSYFLHYVLGRYYIRTKHNISCNTTTGKYAHDMDVQVIDTYDFDYKPFIDDYGNFLAKEFVRDMACFLVKSVAIPVRRHPVSIAMLLMNYGTDTKLYPVGIQTIGIDSYHYLFSDFEQENIDEQHKIK